MPIVIAVPNIEKSRGKPSAGLLSVTKWRYLLGQAFRAEVTCIGLGSAQGGTSLHFGQQIMQEVCNVQADFIRAGLRSAKFRPAPFFIHLMT